MKGIVAPVLEDDLLLSSLVAKAEYELDVKCSLPPPSVLTATPPFEQHHPRVGGFPMAQSACKAGNPGLIPGLGRSPREGHANPLHHSCLENPMDTGSLEGCNP